MHPVESRRSTGWDESCGHLFQGAAQTLAGFTVRDEIAFGPENRGVAPAQIPAVVARAMTRAGRPQAWGDRRITTLSGSERQCVAIAALLAQGAPGAVMAQHGAALAEAGIALPLAVRLHLALPDIAGPGPTAPASPRSRHAFQACCRPTRRSA